MPQLFLLKWGIDFSNFSSEDLLRLATLLKGFFFFHVMPEHLKVCSIGFNYKGAASRWIRYQHSEGPIYNWQEFYRLVINRFDPIGSQPRHTTKFSHVWQTLTVKNYIEEFESLSNRVHGFSVEFKVETFIASLKDEL